jgi:hypothetical protein
MLSGFFIDSRDDSDEIIPLDDKFKKLVNVKLQKFFKSFNRKTRQEIF